MVRAQLILALVVWLLPNWVAAQGDLPALFDVVDVASDDVLNVRAAPSGSAAIIGALSFAQDNVEVVARNGSGRWGLVNLGEASGWVSMRYLARVPGQPSDRLPQPLTCFGTEPFWSLDLDRTSVGLSTPSDVVNFDLLDQQTASGRTDRYAFTATEVLREVHGVVRRAACNDGMSDRSFGLDIDLIVRSGSDATLLTGCCSVALQ